VTYYMQKSGERPLFVEKTIMTPSVTTFILS
jgi:hypothetical protein